MKYVNRKTSALLLAGVVGSCASVVMAADPKMRRAPEPTAPGADVSADRTIRRSVDPASRRYASADKLRGSKVENANKDNVGSVEELIIDRGSGSVAYVVLNAGGFLGIGTKQVAVPFSSFQWDPTNMRLTLESTAEQVKSWPEFKKENWMGTGDSLSTRLSREYYRTPSGYYPSSMPAEDGRVTGTVTRVERRAIPGTNSEEMVVTVLGNDSKSQDIVLGPTWYMAGNTVAVYRDASVDIRVTRVDRDGRPVMVARSLSVDSRDVPLYDEAGSPRWWSKQDSTVMGYPFLLDTDLDGKHIQARGEKCGKIDDLIVECNSGRIAFVSIDPDQNVLGIADTKRLIPWGVANVITTDAVLLDASKSMITNAPETPKDLASITGDSKYQNVYKGFDISEPYYYDQNWDENPNQPVRRDRDLNMPAPSRGPK